VLLEDDGDAPLRERAQEVHRPVEAVDEPAPRGRADARALLAHDRVARALGAQEGDDRLLAGVVGGRHEVRRRALATHVELAGARGPDRRRARAHGALGQVAVARHRAHPGTSGG
jgi:hypothetical protein